MMNVLWLSHLVPYPPKGGVLQRSYNLLKEVSKHNNVTLRAYIQSGLLRSMYGSLESGLEDAEDHLSQFCDEISFVKIPSESYAYGKHMLAMKSLFTKDPYTVNWLKSGEMEDILIGDAENPKYDLIHFDSISLTSYASLFIEKPMILDHHNIESHMMLRRAQQEKNIFKRVYYQIEGSKLERHEKFVCNMFDMNITCSSTDSERLRVIDNRINIEEIPNGVDINYFTPRSNSSLEKHLVFAGGQDWYPNADAMKYFADHIWPILKSREPNVVMNVIGKNPAKSLVELAQNDTNFRVHGFVDDVREYISRAAVYVCPIRDGGGTKLKLLDAFAMGMATVAHPVACEGLNVSDGVNVILAESPEDFADLIIMLFDNDEYRKNIGIGARQLVENDYSFTSIGEKLSGIFSAMV